MKSPPDTSVTLRHEINNNHDLMNSDHLQFTLIKIARIQKPPVWRTVYLIKGKRRTFTSGLWSFCSVIWKFPGSSSGHFSEERTDPEEYVEMGKRRSVQFADSEDKYGCSALPKDKGGPFLVEIEKFRSPTISPDKHNENVSAKNSSSNKDENDERLKLHWKACGFSYETFSGSSSGPFLTERTDPEEYVEMGKKRGVHSQPSTKRRDT